MLSVYDLPPGFEGAHPANLLKNKVSQIPSVKWRCPPRFALNSTWQVVSGEESREVETQKQREMRVLEAVYPRPSAIPSNPSLPTAIEDLPHNDDLSTPLIPITPIEDVDAAGDTSAEPDVAVAAYAAALTALVTSNGQRNLIDLQLLIKILSDPKMIERLITDYRATTLPEPPLPPPPPPPVQISRTAGASSLAAPLGGPFYIPTPNTEGTICNPQRPPPPEVLKDINYYKSLIRQHGGERRDNPKPRDSKPKVMKPCIYFNSSRGCRHGANCSYQHDLSSQKGARSLPEVRSAKRVKLDREITGS